MLRRLIVMRHAKSSWKGETSDHDRPLSKRGRREAPLVAAQLEARGWSPELVVSSDSARTRETMARMVDEFHPWPQVEFTPALYLAGPHAMREVVAGVADEIATVMALGHNPGWEEAVEWLAGEHVQLATADAALLESSGDTWREALREEGTWQLVDVVRAGDIDDD
jgi:phosphohistidine phosphatase SixA